MPAGQPASEIQFLKQDGTWQVLPCPTHTTTARVNWDSNGHVRMWQLDHKERWALMNWCFWTVVLEKTLESPLDCKEIQLFNSKGNQPWIVTGRIDAEAEAPVLWPPVAKSQLTGKEPDAEKDWGQEEKWAKEDEMSRWHRWLSGHEFGQTLGNSLCLLNSGP